MTCERQGCFDISVDGSCFVVRPLKKSYSQWVEWFLANAVFKPLFMFGLVFSAALGKWLCWPYGSGGSSEYC